MSALVVQCLRTVRELLADPRRWVKGFWSAHRDARGVVHSIAAGDYTLRANCWCLGQAITNAVLMNTGGIEAGRRQTTSDYVRTFSELRSDVERELLADLDSTRWPVAYLFNDDTETSHADVITLLDKTLARLEAA